MEAETQPTPEAAPTPEQQLESLRARYSGLAAAVDEGVMSLEAAIVEATKRGDKPRSGY